LAGLFNTISLKQIFPGSSKGSERGSPVHEGFKTIPKKTKGIVSQGLEDLDYVESRVGPDTTELWDAYHRQALLWRAIAFLQSPALILAAILALFTFFYSDRVVEAPSRPQPTLFEIEDISDDDLVEFAVGFVNRLAAYQTVTAEGQFRRARQMLWEPALTAFNKEIMDKQLGRIINTNRSQVFFLSPSRIRISRGENTAEVRIAGKRQKLIGAVPRPSDEIAWFVTLTTIPANELNKYGLVVIDLKPVPVTLKELDAMDRKQEQEARQNR